jgi:DNA-binding NarL/FixJ family response regulator
MHSVKFGAVDSTDGGSPLLSAAAVVFASIALLIAFDIADDYQSGSTAGHLLVEGTVMALAAGGLAALWRQLRSARRHASLLMVDLLETQREARRFREEAREVLRGLGEAIDQQFTRWGLTPAEREVGLLLLKGFSHKEAADLRKTSETTIRQQALAVYRKAGLHNRAELSAFFLEDLLLPVEQSIDNV